MSLEPCTFLLDTGEGCLPISSSDTGQLSLLSGMDTPAKFLENELPMAGSPVCECMKGMSACSIHPSTPEAWIASMRDSLAKTLALLESRQAYLREPDQVFTGKSCASLAWYDQDSCSWKTYQQSLVMGWEPYSETWPRWGMTAGGSAFVHPMSERRITETDGFCLPTPRANSAMASTITPESAWAGNRFPNLETVVGRQIWPTPTTDSASNRSSKYAQGGMPLALAVKMFPTPNASDCRDRGNMSMPSIQRRAAIGKQLNLSMVVSETSGALNPPFVEWLMGFPIGFTVSKGWETPKSRYKRQLPTACLEGVE